MLKLRFPTVRKKINFLLAPVARGSQVLLDLTIPNFRLISEFANHSQTGLKLISSKGWRQGRDTPSLSEVYRSITVATGGSPFRRFLTFVGPGYLVAVGYMDPGNWATSLAGGARFGYALPSYRW